MSRAAGESASARAAALESTPFCGTQTVMDAVMKRILALAALTLLCAACAGGTPSSNSASGITMYGTIDEGISVHK
jgi:hypothetical protein